MIYSGYIPIRDTSASNLPNPDRLYMVLKAYYDGSGKPNDPYCSYLTLTGIIATEDVWPEFENLWAQSLANHDISYFHMVDAIHGRGIFSDSTKWTRENKLKLIADLFNVLGILYQQKMWAFSCVIDLHAYRKAKNELKKLKPAEAICVEYCIQGLRASLGKVEKASGKNETIEMYFDRNERFIDKIHKIWEKRRDHPGTWTRRISGLSQHSMEDVLPLQAVDMLAWTVNRNHSPKVDLRQSDQKYSAETLALISAVSSIIMVKNWIKVFDYQEIVKWCGDSA